MGGNFLRNMCGELFFAAVHLANRSSHATLRQRTPFSKMHDKEADLTDSAGYRTQGIRAHLSLRDEADPNGMGHWVQQL